ncbi:hypothetical protein F5Y17DRAFT_453435 [Xylariaceae sp. FL0594]|nr:hypothetical protein F5Y17DRAFT_453435 [Xylariaceae sp. FL0594]
MSAGQRVPHTESVFVYCWASIRAAIMYPNAIHADVAYSQEHLDRIVSELMELNPRSNTPPPAAEDAIASLPKKLDKEMLGPELKGECTIYIDELKVGALLAGSPRIPATKSCQQWIPSRLLGHCIPTQMHRCIGPHKSKQW